LEIDGLIPAKLERYRLKIRYLFARIQGRIYLIASYVAVRFSSCCHSIVPLGPLESRFLLLIKPAMQVLCQFRL
jgi:hypothetical protein